MEDSRPIFFCKRFSYNENALYRRTTRQSHLPPESAEWAGQPANLFYFVPEISRGRSRPLGDRSEVLGQRWYFHSSVI